MSMTAHHPLINSQCGPVTFTPRGTAIVDKIARTLRLWGARIKERQAFPILDDRELHDLGVSRWELQRELAKPFWRD
jgi:uncharacterized protein YjiS (DUF1127 family)